MSANENASLFPSFLIVTCPECGEKCLVWKDASPIRCYTCHYILRSKKGTKGRLLGETRLPYLEDFRQYWYNHLHLYRKKLDAVDSYLPHNGTHLDIGMAWGELIELERLKYEQVYGLDIEKEMIDIAKALYADDMKVKISLSSAENLKNDYPGMSFNSITCLDVFEHLKIEVCEQILKDIYDLLVPNGIFIATFPGLLEKIKILLKLNEPYHLHCHSSYGWGKMIADSGLKIVTIKAVQFPIIDNKYLREHMHLFGITCLVVASKGV